MHIDIQEKLLLYLDGDLPDEEMKKIRAHLATCSLCMEHHDALAAIWQPERSPGKVTPSPFLWTRLQARIKEYEQTPAFVWDLKRSLQGITARPVSALAVLAAIVAGIYLGTPRVSQNYEMTQSINQLVGASDDLGLNQFDVIPPGTLGSTLITTSTVQK